MKTSIQALVAEGRARFGREFVDRVEKELRSRRNDRAMDTGCLAVIVLFVLLLLTGTLLLWARHRMLAGAPTTDGRVVEKTIRRRSKGGDSYRVRYQFEYDGRKYVGASNFRKSDYDRLSEGTTITVHFLPERPSVSSAANEISPLSNFIPVAILGVFLTFGFISKVRKGRQKRRVLMANTQFVRSLTAAGHDPPVRTVIDEMKPLWPKSIAVMTMAWSMAESPRKCLRLMGFESPAVDEWWESQPPPVDFQEYLARLEYVGVRLLGEKTPEPVHVSGSGPDTIPLASVEGLATALIGPVVIAAHEGRRGRVRIDLSGFDRDAAERRREESERIETKIRAKLHWTQAQEEGHIEKARKDAGVEPQSRKIEAEGIGPEIAGAESSEIRDIVAVSMIGSCLYNLYLCPWNWVRVQREFRVTSDDKPTVALELDFDPHRYFELRAGPQ